MKTIRARCTRKCECDQNMKRMSDGRYQCQGKGCLEIYSIDPGRSAKPPIQSNSRGIGLGYLDSRRRK